MPIKRTLRKNTAELGFKDRQNVDNLMVVRLEPFVYDTLLGCLKLLINVEIIDALVNGRDARYVCCLTQVSTNAVLHETIFCQPSAPESAKRSSINMAVSRWWFV